MKKGFFKKAAVELVVVMLIALIPSAGLALTPPATMAYYSNTPGNQSYISDTVPINFHYTIRENPFNMPGYIFTGWNTQANGSGYAFDPGQLRVLSWNMVLYAQWRSAAASPAAITYKANANDSQADIIDTVTKGSPYIIRANPFTRSGYTFAGWNTQANGTGSVYNPNKRINANGNHILYAQWKYGAAPCVTITYKSSDGQADIIDTPLKGSSYTVRYNSYYIYPGYMFMGWNTDPYGSGNAVKEGQNVIANGNYTLHAQWAYNQTKVSVTYKANANDGQEDAIEITNKGRIIPLKRNPFTRDGYEFDSWNSKPDGTGGKFNAGQLITANANYVLYAQWKLGED